MFDLNCESKLLYGKNNLNGKSFEENHVKLEKRAEKYWQKGFKKKTRKIKNLYENFLLTNVFMFPIGTSKKNKKKTAKLRK